MCVSQVLLGLTGLAFSGRILSLWNGEDAAQSIHNTSAAAFLVASIALTLLIGDTMTQEEKPEVDTCLWLGMLVFCSPHFVMSTLQTAWWQGSLGHFILVLPLLACLHLEYTPPAVLVACWLGNSAAMYHTEYTTRCAFLHGIAFTAAGRVEGPGCSTELMIGCGTGNGTIGWAAENPFLDHSLVQDTSLTTHQQPDVYCQSLTEIHDHVSKLWGELSKVSPPLSTSVNDVAQESSLVNQQKVTQVLEDSKRTVAVLLGQLNNLSSLHSTAVSSCESPDQDSFSFATSCCADTSNSTSDQCTREFISPPHEDGSSHNKRKAMPPESPVLELYDFTGIICSDPTTSRDVSHAQSHANRNSHFTSNVIPENWTALYEKAAKDTLAVSMATDAAKCAPPWKPPDKVKVRSHCVALIAEVSAKSQEVANPAKRLKSKFDVLPKLKFHESRHMKLISHESLTIPPAPNEKQSNRRKSLAPRAKFRNNGLIFEEHGTAGKKLSRTFDLR